jgi:hypothetical protein
VADSHAATIRERNRRVFASPFGAVYDFYIQREPLARLVGRLAWHSDVRSVLRQHGHDLRNARWQHDC